MKERSIIFNSEMVQAILEGRKTQTRRVIKPQPKYTLDKSLSPVDIPCPYGKPGDLLWVRETWQMLERWGTEFGGAPYEYDLYDGAIPKEQSRNIFIEYRADGYGDGPWHPSIFMPRWASRIMLEVTGVRVERVKDISWDDALAEGIYHHGKTCCSIDMFSVLAEEELTHGYDTPGCCDSPVGSFSYLWDSIHGNTDYS